MDYHFSTIGRLIVALILAVLAQADYIMDDSNITIQYVNYWERDNYLYFNVSSLYNDTATISFGGSITTNNQSSYVSIPFIGTGIIVYVATLPVDQLNISCALDANPPSTSVFSWNGFNLYNGSVYNTQELAYGAHTLNITNVGDEFNNMTAFAFDYAVISTPLYIPISTPISTLISSSAIPSSTEDTSTSNPRSQKQLPAIGGAIGGVAAITLAVVITVLYYRKKCLWRRRPHVEVDLGPKESSFYSTRFISNSPVNPSHDWSPYSLPGDINLQNNDISPPHIPPPDTPPVTEHIPSPALSAALHHPAEAEAVARAFAAPISTSSPMNAGLTEEQSELVQGLLRQNIPLVTVVGVMEGLLGREGPPGGGEGSGSRIVQRDVRPEADDPPDYVSV